MTSEGLLHKDTIEFDGHNLDVTYHENEGEIVLDKVTYAGTNRLYRYGDRQDELKDKLSGRF